MAALGDKARALALAVHELELIWQRMEEDHDTTDVAGMDAEAMDEYAAVLRELSESAQRASSTVNALRVARYGEP